MHYLLLADRGIHAKVDTHESEQVCRAMEAAFGQGRYDAGVVAGIGAVAQHLTVHFPATADPNELPDQPVVL